MKIGVFQFTGVLDYSENLRKIRGAAKEASEQGASALFLPECFYSISDGVTTTPYLVEEGNEHEKNIQLVAKDFKIELIGGSVAYLKNGEVFNRSTHYSKTGEEKGYYDKIHLFSCNLKKNEKTKKIDESDMYTAGNDPAITQMGRLKIGHNICFDLRFPEMACTYSLNGANLLSYASAFTVPTGKAHWHTLLRARAIENQCFVVAAAQYGHHNDKIQTYGHSLIVDPWGEVLVDLKEGEKLVVQELDLSRIQEVRDSIPIFN